MITFTKLGNLGRFGNQLFQYAGVRLYALHVGSDFALPSWIGCEIFNGVKPWNTRQKIISYIVPRVRLTEMKTGKKALLMSKLGLISLSSMDKLYAKPRKNINLYGYLQDDKSLEELKNNILTVREWFAIKPEVEKVFRKAVGNINYTAIHIRRGDFVKRGLSVPESIYLEWLNNNQSSNPVYISSDDLNIKGAFKRLPLLEVKNPLPNIPDFIFDFWMLKNSQILLGCGSTFSWWAGILGGQTFFSPPLTHKWPPNYSPTLEKQQL